MSNYVVISAVLLLSMVLRTFLEIRFSLATDLVAGGVDILASVCRKDAVMNGVMSGSGRR